METDISFCQVDNVALAYADGFYHLIANSPMANQKVPLTVINEFEATSQGYGRGLGETVIVQPDGSLLHAGLVFVKNQ